VKQLADLVHDLAATGDAGVDVGADLLEGEHRLRGCGVGARVAVDEDGGDALAGGLFDGLDGGAGTDQIEGGLDVELGHAGLLEDGVLVALALVVGAGHVVAPIDQLLGGGAHVGGDFGGCLGGNNAAGVQILVGGVHDAGDLLILGGDALGTLLATRLHLVEGRLQLLLRLPDDLIVLVDQGQAGGLANLGHLVHHAVHLGVQLGGQLGGKLQRLGPSAGHEKGQDNDCGGSHDFYWFLQNCNCYC